MSSAPDVHDLSELRDSLERRFRTTVSHFDVGTRRLAITHPVSAEDLIDEREFEQDERLPYWADVWPSARILAQLVAERDGSGQSLLELGCGAGLVTTAAMLAGFEVCATDYYADALLFTELNARAHSGEAPTTRLVDWRQLPTTLGRFNLVVGSDVLYERTYGALVARAIDVTLARRGAALIADPGRMAATDFLRDCAKRGLQLAGEQRLPFVDGQVRQTITVYTLRRA